MILKGLKAIFVVAGHGLKGGNTDPGAVAKGTTERAEVVEIANELVYLLKNQPKLGPVYKFDIGVDANLTLDGKVAQIESICKKYGLNQYNSLLVSVHVNAGGGTGSEAWYYTNSRQGRALGSNLAQEVSRFTGIPYRGSKPDVINRWGSLKIVRVPPPLSVLIECGFIDSANDSRLLRDSELDDGFAKGIASGIMKYLGERYDDISLANVKKFKDVEAGSWYEDSVAHVVGEGLMAGYPDGTFKPAQPITRAEAAKLFSLLLKRVDNG
jgi:N-acetylmuramoyl-L-alanine amidase